MRLCFSPIIYTLHCRVDEANLDDVSQWANGLGNAERWASGLNGPNGSHGAAANGSSKHVEELYGWAEVVTPMALRAREIIRAGHDLKVGITTS